MQTTRQSEGALPGVDLMKNVFVHAEIVDVTGGKALLLAVPMQALGGLLDASPQFGTAPSIGRLVQGDRPRHPARPGGPDRMAAAGGQFRHPDRTLPALPPTSRAVCPRR